MRTVITKAKATMGVATLEDLQGSLEVIVFPKILQATAPTWRADAIVLVAGRVDHKGDGGGLLADAVWGWGDGEGPGARGGSGSRPGARRLRAPPRARRSGRGRRRNPVPWPFSAPSTRSRR